MSESRKILVVDDQRSNVKLLQKLLSQMEHEAIGAENAFVALDILDRSFDLVLADVMMPEMDGFTMVREIRNNPETQDIPIIMVTALSEKEDRLKAVEAGANDFISKPVDRSELQVRTNSLLRQKKQQDEIKAFQKDLHKMVETKTHELRQAFLQIERSHVESIQHLSAAAEYKDEETSAHIKRMSKLSALIAKRMSLSTNYVNLIATCSPMHDVGKIGIPDKILLKPGKLSAEEWEIMKTHTTIGENILSSGHSEYMELGTVIALTHHEKWDGSGYPQGLSGEDIPLAGRICAVADVFDALTSKRPYKEAFSIEKSIGIMQEVRGKHFDPDILDLFLQDMDEVLRIKEEFSDNG